LLFFWRIGAAWGLLTISETGGPRGCGRGSDTIARVRSRRAARVTAVLQCDADFDAAAQRRPGGGNSD
jgi:hypothetical protein